MKFLGSLSSKLAHGLKIAILEPTKLYRFLLKCYRLGFLKTIKKFFIHSYTDYENDFDLSLKSFTILTTPHCLIIAKQLKYLLERVGFECEITHQETEFQSSVSKCIPIVLAPQIFSKLPKKFIAFQLEQPGSPWFTSEYLSLLKKATFVLEFSEKNLDYLQKQGLSFETLYYCPIFPNGYAPKIRYIVSDNKEYDLVFYGALNERRKKIIEVISNKYNVLVLSDLFGDELYNQLNRARLLINIHFYNNAALETTRLTEAKAFGIDIISESSSSSDIDSQFSEFVTFAKSGDIPDLLAKISFLLNKKEKAEHKIINHQSRFSPFDFFFLRFLLAQDLISFEAFSDFFLESYPQIKDALCLSLPETVERKNKFISQKDSINFAIFPGLRHKLGWIGCGYSYKFIFSLALIQSKSNITICEDDVVLPKDYDLVVSKIRNFLDREEGNWQVFSGLISDISPKARVLSVQSYENIKFVYLDEAVGLVYSIFSTEAIKTLEQWTPNKDLDNTIDRFMSKKVANFITCIPFLVNQDESLVSTLWDERNGDIYKDYISSTLNKLAKKVYEYESSSTLAR